MSEQNPYSPSAELVGVKSVAAGRGLSWFGEGFEIFKLAPWLWILNVVVFFVILAVLSAIPVVSILTSLLTPVFVAGLILGCRDLDEGNELKLSHVFAGFQNRAGHLIGLGAINVILTILFVVIMFGAVVAMGDFDPEAWETGQMTDQQVLSMILAVLVMTLFMIPLLMLFWFAPTLIVLNNDVGIIEAMKLSFLGCIRNILPFLIYGIVGFILMIVASIPFGLGWLVLGPVLFGTIYASYKDIFLE